MELSEVGFEIAAEQGQWSNVCALVLGIVHNHEPI